MRQGVHMPDRLPRRLEGLLEEVTELGGQLRDLQGRFDRLVSAVLKLDEDLSLEGMLQRLSDSAKTLLGAAGAEVRLVTASQPSRGASEQASPNPRHGAAAEHLPPALTVPLTARGTALGELSASRMPGDAPFTEEDEEILAVLAAAAGPMLWNARLYEESARRTAWLEAILAAASDLVGDEDEIRGQELDLVAQRALKASASALAVVAAPVGRSFQIAAVAGTLPSQDALDGLPHRPALQAAARQPTEGEASQWLGPEAARSFGPAVAVPLGPRGGVLLLARGRTAAPFTAAGLPSASLFGSTVALALELRALASLRDAAAVSRDRRRIARDLHDVVIQRLFATALTLRRIGPLAATEIAARRVESIMDELDTAIREVRRLVGVLDQDQTPAERKPEPFSGALLKTVRNSTAGSGLDVRITIDGSAERIPRATAQRLLSLTAESLSHARGTGNQLQLDLAVTVREEDVELALQPRVAALDGSRLAWTFPLADTLP
jgi:signal transduction histidine kinase